MYLNFENIDMLKVDFENELTWFEEEFDFLFGMKFEEYSKADVILANKILDELSETINKYPGEELLFYLVCTLNRIKENYPKLI
ncbi:MAG: hypothetical protein P8Y70_12435 [Candidatus Lokiarchaeota archaeon]